MSNKKVTVAKKGSGKKTKTVKENIVPSSDSTLRRRQNMRYKCAKLVMSHGLGADISDPTEKAQKIFDWVTEVQKEKDFSDL